MPIPQQLITKIKSGGVSDKDFKEFLAFQLGKNCTVKEVVSEGLLTQAKFESLFSDDEISALPVGIQELIQEGLLSQERYNKMRSREIKKKLMDGEYTDEDIENMVFEGVLDPTELVQEGIMTEQKRRRLFPEKVKVPFGSWKDVPPLVADRVDVFVLGLASSGKSCFMAGLLHYTESAGKLKTHIKNTTAFDYVNILVEAVENAQLPPPTSVDYVQHMACDFRNSTDRSKIHPLTFIEMSGELFEKCHSVKSTKDLPAKMREYFFESANRKIVFLAVDYYLAKEGNTQRKHFDFILKFFEDNGMMQNHLEAIVLIVTKWDRSPDTSDAAALEFINKKYAGLKTLCEEYEEKYGVQFIIENFSLGKFRNENSYTYDEKDSAKIYELLCQIASYMKVKTNTKSSTTGTKKWWKF